MKQVKKNLLLLVFIVAINYISNCQTFPVSSDIIVEHYTLEHGLKQSMVSSILQDQNGLIWVATGGGLHLFNGNEFVNYKKQSDNLIRQIVELDNNQILCFSSSEIACFNKNNLQYSTIIYKKGLYPVNTGIKMNQNTIIWIPFKGFHFINHQKKIINISDFLKIDTQIDSTKQFINAIKHKNAVFACFENSVAKITINNWGNIKNIEQFNFESNNHKIVKHKNQILLFSGNRIFKYQESFYPIQSLPIGSQINVFSNNKHDLLIFDKNSHSLYSFSDKNGLIELNINIKVNKHLVNIKPFIKDIYYSNNGDLWMGTDSEGLLFYPKGNFQFTRKDIGFVRCFAEQEDTIYIGTFKNGLWTYTNNTLTKSNIIDKNLSINDIKFDHRKRLWIVTNSEAQVFDKNKKIFSTPIQGEFSKIHILNPDSLIISENGAATLFNISNKIEIISKQKIIYFHQIEKIDSFYLYASQFGLFYTSETNLINTNTITEDNFLINEPVKAFYIKNNFLFIASLNGISRYKINSTDTKIEISLKYKYPLNENIYSIIPDENFNFWCSSDNGIYFVNNQTQNIINFDQHYNIQSLEFNSSSFLKSQKNDIYFGGIQGFNKIDCSDFSENSPHTKATILNLYLNDTLYKSNFYDSLLQINLPYNFSGIDVELFSGRYFANKKHQYSFYLKNFHNSWTSFSTSNKIKFHKLPVGKFVLFCKIKDELNNISETKLFTVVIHPPFWQHTWFLIVLSLLTIGILYLIISKIQKFKYQRKIKKIELQYELERERVRISRDIHDELGSGLSLILLNANFAETELNQEEKAKTHIKNIQKYTKNIYESMNNLIWLINQDNQTIDILHAKMRELISDILDDTNLEYELHFTLENSNKIIRKETFRNIYLIIKEAINNCIKHSDAKNITVQSQFINDYYLINIKTDGKKFPESMFQSKGNGLKNMQARANSVNGEIEWKNIQKESTHIGTELVLKIHLEK